MPLEILTEPLPGKGVTKCNRTACQCDLTPGYRWWNTSTRAFYCQRCAFRINESNPVLCIREDSMPPGGENNLMAFLESAGQGCISGNVSDWPQLKPACKWAVERIRKLQAFHNCYEYEPTDAGPSQMPPGKEAGAKWLAAKETP